MVRKSVTVSHQASGANLALVRDLLFELTVT